MPAAGYRIFEYFLIRLAPNPIRYEPVNIGVAIFERGGPFVRVRMVGDYSRVRKLSGAFLDADLLGLQEDLTQWLQTLDPAWESREYLLNLAGESFGQSLQFSEAKGVLASDPSSELDLIFEREAQLFKPLTRDTAADPRRAIRRHLQKTFIEEGVFELLHLRMSIAAISGDPDPYHFDFHYRCGRINYCIHALPLEGSDSSIREFCFSVGRLSGQVDLQVDAVTGSSAHSANQQLHANWLAEAGVQLRLVQEAPTMAAEIRQRLSSA